MRVRKWNYIWMLTWFWIVLIGLEESAIADTKHQKITLFAAASTTNAITEIVQLFEQSHPVMVRVSLASSSTLAKQIGNGAPADIFLSANPKWMNYLADKGIVTASNRWDLLSNRIVLIAPKASHLKNISVDASLDLHLMLGKGRLSMGDSNHVPAGIYGKKAFEKLGLWHSIKDSLAPAKDVRAALVLVERGETPLGQVYATDAAISNKVRVIGVFPENSHPRIIYPVAIIKESMNAKQFIGFLQSPKVIEIFQKYGFITHQ